MTVKGAGLTAALFLLATTGWAITIPLTDPTYGAFSTGLDFSGAPVRGLIEERHNQYVLPKDGNWMFYAGDSISALPTSTPLGAWVVNTQGRPFQSPENWTPNSDTSRWISPTKSTRGNGQHLDSVGGTSYIALLSFSIPDATLLPPGWSQWFLFMSGSVWADDSLADQFYLLDENYFPVGTFAIRGNPSYNSAGFFRFSTWVDPGATYRLAFLLNNTANSAAGFRLEFTEAYVTPEPGSWALMLSAGAGLAYLGWRRRRLKKSLAHEPSSTDS